MNLETCDLWDIWSEWGRDKTNTNSTKCKKSWQHLELVSKSYNFFCWFFQFSTFREFCRFEYICTHQLNSTLYLQVQVQSTRHFHRQRIQRPNSKVICLYTVHCTLYSQSANTTWTDLNRADTTPYLAAWKKLVQSHSPGKIFVQLWHKIMINLELKIRLQIQICTTSSFTNYLYNFVY